MTGLIHEMTEVVMGVIADEVQAREVVSRIVRRFGGSSVYMPSEDYRGRNERIIELVAAGVAVSDVASRYRLSKATVYRITNNGISPPAKRGRPRKQ